MINSRLKELENMVETAKNSEKILLDQLNELGGLPNNFEKIQKYYLKRLEIAKEEMNLTKITQVSEDYQKAVKKYVNANITRG